MAEEASVQPVDLVLGGRWDKQQCWSVVDGRGVKVFESEKDAKLYAAGPALLAAGKEALEDLQLWADEYCCEVCAKNPCSTQDIIAKLKAAIALAE